MMPVYLIRAGETEMVKIGWADRDVEERRRELQTAHWAPLSVIRTIETSAASERWMHRRFASRHVAYEWFRFHPDMLVVSPPAFVPSATEALINQLGGLATVSTAAKVERNTVTYWKARERIPPEHWDALIGLAAERGVEGVDHTLMLRLHRPRKPRSDRAHGADPTQDAAA